MGHPVDSSWQAALYRAGRALRPHRPVRRNTWSVLVPLVALLAGLLFSMTAHAAHGTPLRDDRNPQPPDLIADRQRQLDQLNRIEAGLRKQVEQQTDLAGGSDAGIKAAQQRGDDERGAAGLTAVRGPGVTVRLDDAPRRPDGTLPAGVNADDLVVHQQDVQAVVNALWAGGAEAISIMGVRVISTSAVKCVGNTLLLNGRVYSPPFVVSAIGDPDRMRSALDASVGVQAFRAQAATLGLGYSFKAEGDLPIPAYDGSTSLQYAQGSN